MYFMSSDNGPHAPGLKFLLRGSCPAGAYISMGHNKSGSQRTVEVGTNCCCQGKEPLMGQFWQEEQANRKGQSHTSFPPALQPHSTGSRLWDLTGSQLTEEKGNLQIPSLSTPWPRKNGASELRDISFVTRMTPEGAEPPKMLGPYTSRFVANTILSQNFLPNCRLFGPRQHSDVSSLWSLLVSPYFQTPKPEKNPFLICFPWVFMLP